jgi:hypothetical protein
MLEIHANNVVNELIGTINSFRHSAASVSLTEESTFTNNNKNQITLLSACRGVFLVDWQARIVFCRPTFHSACPAFPFPSRNKRHVQLRWLVRILCPPLGWIVCSARDKAGVLERFHARRHGHLGRHIHRLGQTDGYAVGRVWKDRTRPVVPRVVCTCRAYRPEYVPWHYSAPSFSCAPHSFPTWQ